jgi:hypothetical protein
MTEMALSKSRWRVAEILEASADFDSTATEFFSAVFGGITFLRFLVQKCFVLNREAVKISQSRLHNRVIYIQNGFVRYISNGLFGSAASRSKGRFVNPIERSLEGFEWPHLVFIACQTPAG